MNFVVLIAMLLLVFCYKAQASCQNDLKAKTIPEQPIELLVEFKSENYPKCVKILNSMSSKQIYDVFEMMDKVLLKKLFKHADEEIWNDAMISKINWNDGDKETREKILSSIPRRRLYSIGPFLDENV